MEEARLEAYVRSMKELETKREVGRRTREARSFIIKQVLVRRSGCLSAPLRRPLQVQRGFVASNKERLADWEQRVSEAKEGVAHMCCLFPVGDAILEPFWPQVCARSEACASAHLVLLSLPAAACPRPYLPVLMSFLRCVHSCRDLGRIAASILRSMPCGASP